VASNLTPAGTVLNGMLGETGWSEDTQLELALRFISDVAGAVGDKTLVEWHEFLQEHAAEESSEAPITLATQIELIVNVEDLADHPDFAGLATILHQFSESLNSAPDCVDQNGRLTVKELGDNLHLSDAVILALVNKAFVEGYICTR